MERTEWLHASTTTYHHCAPARAHSMLYARRSWSVSISNLSFCAFLCILHRWEGAATACTALLALLVLALSCIVCEKATQARILTFSAPWDSPFPMSSDHLFDILCVVYVCMCVQVWFQYPRDKSPDLHFYINGSSHKRQQLHLHLLHSQPSTFHFSNQCQLLLCIIIGNDWWW